jgi:hypothetical protein
MSYLETKVLELRAQGCTIQPVDGVAHAVISIPPAMGGELYLLIGGDAPIAIELAAMPPEAALQALVAAARSTSVTAAAWEAMVSSIGGRVCAW